MSVLRLCLGVLLMSAAALPALCQTAPRRDAFFWLGEINKASAVINVDEGLLDRALAPRIAAGLRAVLEAGARPGAQRPSLVITFEPLLIEAAGVEATLLHAGRSSQDMLATVRAAMLRDELLRLATQLRRVTATLVRQAEQHSATVVPNYTNGVAAQPNSYGHYLLGHVAGFERDAERLRQAMARLDLSPMGTTVLNGTSWPLNRERMARYLGFPGVVDNAYDAAQILAAEMPVEIGALMSGIALHVGAFIEDVMQQYAQPRPWILLREGDGNTYVSSAMPQKRNPGLLINTRADASRVIALGFGRLIQAHNIPPGMSDAKGIGDNVGVIVAATRMLESFDRVLNALVINPERALEELNLDWTASQEVADVLMREHRLPFRVGHHVASEIVGFARAHGIAPSDFPYAEAQRIYAETLRHEMNVADGVLPLSEAAFRSALDPVSIVRNRATAGGPQPAEMARMIAAAQAGLAMQEGWIRDRQARVDGALAALEVDFGRLLASGN